jgi:hypothetical protein
METYDWTQFKLKIPVMAKKEKIYHAWASREGLESWFLRKALLTSADGSELPSGQNATEGSTYNWYWHGWDDNMVEKGEVVEANGSDRFSFTFGSAGTVHVSIGIEEGDTVVQLLQDGIPSNGQVKFHLGCSNGWTFYLANLKSVLEGGLDLRNRNKKIRNVVSS